ncbi:MAG: hypothetical protein COA60_005780 [Robiginitomaculum sp.]|nr:hypothetical protein [Robiginitomaculum sp.]
MRQNKGLDVMPKDVTAKTASDGVIFEFVIVGDSQKVSAIDIASGIEVSIISPLNAERSYVQEIAMRKLNRRLQREIQPTKGDGIIT